VSGHAEIDARERSTSDVATNNPHHIDARRWRVMSSPENQRLGGVTTGRRRRAFALACAASAVLLAGCSSGGASGDASRAVPPLSLTDLTDVSTPLNAAEVEPPSPAAASPDEAVATFVRLEAAGDHISSWGLLDADLRSSLRTAHEWERRHARLPQLVSFEPTSTSADEGGAVEVTGAATFVPELDEVVGAVPRRATVTWRAVAEDGGWRVDFGGTSVRGDWPDDSTARAAVEQWLHARRRCEPPRDLEYGAGLVGAAGRADDLCGNDRPVDVADAERLGDVPDPGPVLAAFGPGADLWARQLELSGGADGHVVVAPLGETWIVIGLLA
jgi:hypothetical protein